MWLWEAGGQLCVLPCVVPAHIIVILGDEWVENRGEKEQKFWAFYRCPGQNRNLLRAQLGTPGRESVCVRTHACAPMHML